jgi:hypothetical protein
LYHYSATNNPDRFFEIFKTMLKKWMLFAVCPILAILFLLFLFAQPPQFGEAIVRLNKHEASPQNMRVFSQLPSIPAHLQAEATPTISDEESRNEKEQIALAMQLLASSNDHQRIEGLELLGAYPSPNSEAILVEFLKGEGSPEIRSTAATSLATMEIPSVSTIETLMNTLEDRSEDVRYGALSTLEDYLIMADKGSPIQQRIHSGFIKKFTGNNLSEDIRKDVQEIINSR